MILYAGSLRVVKLVTNDDKQVTARQVIVSPASVVANNKYEALGWITLQARQRFPESEGWQDHVCQVHEIPETEQRQTALMVHARELAERLDDLLGTLTAPDEATMALVNETMWQLVKQLTNPNNDVAAVEQPLGLTTD